SLSTRQLQIADMARARRSTALKVKSYAQDSGSEEEEDEDEEMKVEGELESEFEETASVGSKRSTKSVQEDYVEDTEDFVPEEKKKSKSKGKGKAVGRGRAGKLQSMVNLPIDVWFSIAEDLDPLSLLYLGRANKMMRSLFASKTRSKGLWNIVKRSVHLPDLDSTDINDLQLTSLIWERNCHVCGKPRAVLVDYCLRKRWCKFCRSKNLVLATRLRTQINSCVPELPKLSLSTIQGPTNHNWNQKRYHFKAEAQQVNNKVIAYQEVVESAKGKKLTAAAQEELDVYLDEREALVKTAYEDGKKLAIWERSSAADRQAQDAAARQARTAAIKAKLVELGYDDRDFSSMWRVKHLLDQPTALTPIIWNRISPKIIENVESSKRERLEREAGDRTVSRRKKVEPFFEALRDDAKDKLFPSLTLFLSMPAVQPLWKEEDSTIDEEIWHSSLDEIKSQLPKVKRWIRLEFARELIKTYDEITHPVSQELRKSIHFPEPTIRAYSRFDHSTSLNIDDPSTVSSSDLDILLSRFTANFSSTAPRQVPIDWLVHYSSHGVHGVRNAVPKKWLQAQLEILKQTGLQDSADTGQALEKLGANFDCQGCHNHLKYQPTYSWLNTAPVLKPTKSTGLTWSEMTQHAFEFHADGFNTSYYTVPTIRYGKAESPKVISSVDRLIAESENQIQEEEEVDALYQYEQDQVQSLIETHEPSPGEADIDVLVAADVSEKQIEEAFEGDEEVDALLETHGVGNASTA
ncbi:hypothetical protein JCM5353_001800, partial [Sporobolomyces roseus]